MSTDKETYKTTPFKMLAKIDNLLDDVQADVLVRVLLVARRFVYVSSDVRVSASSTVAEVDVNRVYTS